jgi:hypothetical protein
MTSSIRVVLAGAVACAVVVCGAQAQQKMTLGDLQDRGARKLTSEEIKALVAGATLAGAQGGNFPEVTFENVYAADGSVTGKAWRSGVLFTTIKGKWSIDQGGQLCSDLLNDRQDKIAGCFSFYALGNNYYAARGDTRSAEANQRTIKR